MNQLHFDDLGQTYAAFVATDPIRLKLHYPAVMQLLSDLAGKLVVDMGCGDGLFGRILATECGARVVGYDISPALIAAARQCEKEKELGIAYEVATPGQFDWQEQADYATAVMVLPYCPGQSDLTDFFTCAKRLLKPDGQFVCVTFNPEFTDFDRVVANRIFRDLGTGNVQVNFLNPRQQTCMMQSVLRQLPRRAYDDAASAAGFKAVEWRPLFPQLDDADAFNLDFWQSCVLSQPYSLLACR